MVKKEIINLAIDFGASSGRAIVSKFDGEKIELEEVYRFSNEPVRMGGYFYWDFLRLFFELKNGLRKAANKYKNILSIGVDTWGVDYGLLDENHNLMSNPFHYRDNRTDGILKDIEKIIPYDDIYKTTGIQYMQLNTLYQLFSDIKYRKNTIKNAKALLFMPDLFNFYLTGQKYNEYTEATTSQMIDAEKKQWAFDIINKIGIPTEIFQEFIMPGNIIGTLTEEIQNELEIYPIRVAAVGSHDTASAVAATPIEGENTAFLSCGTWSLLGTEIDKPIINEKSLKYSFTNEGGVENKITFLKNINGLWLMQQLRQSWSEKVSKVSFPDIINAAQNAERKHYVIDPNAEDFMAPLNMAQAIQDYCERLGQGRPEGLGEIAIAAYNGLTNEYKNVVELLEKTTGKKIDTINMVGGGIQDTFLCKKTADVTGKKVLAGPVEASVLGNIIMQLKAIGEIKTLEEGREIIKKSFDQKEYIPTEQ